MRTCLTLRRKLPIPLRPICCFAQVREKLNLHKVRLEIDDVLVPLHHGLEKARLTDKLRLLELIETHAESIQLCYLQSVPWDTHYGPLLFEVQHWQPSIAAIRLVFSRFSRTNERCHFERSGIPALDGYVTSSTYKPGRTRVQMPFSLFRAFLRDAKCPTSVPCDHSALDAHSVDRLRLFNFRCAESPRLLAAAQRSAHFTTALRRVRS